MKPVTKINLPPVQSAEPPITQKSYKLDFVKPLLTIDGTETEEISPSFKGVYADLKQEHYIKVTLNKLLARALANSNEDFEGKEFDWYKLLYANGILTLDEVDTRRLKQFITNKRKAEQPFSNILVQQLYTVFKEAGYKD